VIADFLYLKFPDPSYVVVKMRAEGGEAYGSVAVPAGLYDRHPQLALRDQSNEGLRLPFALAHAVILAGFSNSPLCLSVEREAWPKQWGRLKGDH
jgi:hypothetical protein